MFGGGGRAHCFDMSSGASEGESLLAKCHIKGEKITKNKI